MTRGWLKWNYWMWDGEGNFIHKYDHDMFDHPDGEFLFETGWDEKWTKQLFLTAEQATALSFGRSPDLVPWDNHPSGVQEMDRQSELFKESVQEELDQLNRQGGTPGPILLH